MGDGPDRRRSSKSAKESPVRPGTPLYRLLELIARAIALDLEGGRPEAFEDRPRRRRRR
jgi:hypothetical protein